MIATTVKATVAMAIIPTADPSFLPRLCEKVLARGDTPTSDIAYPR